MALTLDRVGFAYPVPVGEPIEALREVSLCLEPGELVLVLGATGSGKSTLLQIAAGLLGASSGRGEVDGQELSRTAARGVVGMVFQDPESQLFAETALDDVAFGPVNLGAARDDAMRDARTAIGRVLTAEEFAPRSPFALLVGRVGGSHRGRGAMSPRYLLLDEPTAGLYARGLRRWPTSSCAPARAVRRCGGQRATGDESLGEGGPVLLLSDGRAAFEGAASETHRIAGRAFDEAGLVAPRRCEPSS